MFGLKQQVVSGFVFVDALDNHTVFDSNGENIDPVQVGHVSYSGLVTCATIMYMIFNLEIILNLQTWKDII